MGVEVEPLRLLGRRGCHLCDVMEATLLEVLPRYGLRHEKVDVDADPALQSAHGDCVPVLLQGERVLARVRLSRAGLEEILGGRQGVSPAP